MYQDKINDRIIKFLTYVENSYKIAKIIFIIQWILLVLRDIIKLYITGITLVKFSLWGVGTLKIGVAIVGIYASILWGIQAKQKAEKVWKDKPKKILEIVGQHFWLSNPFSYLFFLFTIYIISGKVGGYYAYVYGYTYGLALVPAIIGHIFFIIAYRKAQIYYKNYCNDIKRKADEARKEQEEKQKEIERIRRRENTTVELLNQTGKMFFITYYYQLKTQSVMDILDSIQENYSAELKTKRILGAKEIFDKGLHIDVLRRILKNEDNVANQEMLNRAQCILDNESK